MGLIKRNNSKYWYVQFQMHHRLVVRSTRTTDRRVAERVAAKIRAEAHTEIVLGQRKAISLVEALDGYVRSRASTPNYPNLKGYKRAILNSLPGSMSLTALTGARLEEFARKKSAHGLKPQTIKHLLNCLSGSLRKAREDGYAVASPAFPRIKVSNRRLRYLSRDEEQKLLRELDPCRDCRGLPKLAERTREQQRALQDNYDLVILLLDTGARYSEIANLRWADVDLSARSIRLWRSKVQNESVIYMTERVYSALHRRAADTTSQHIFTSKNGGPRGYCSVALRKALTRAGLHDCTLHTLRHTHATRLIQNGMNVYEVKEVLGHSDIKTTMRYAHLERATITARAREIIQRVNDQHNSKD